MRRFDSAIFWAMRRRRPTTLMVSTAALATRAAAARRGAGRAAQEGVEVVVADAAGRAAAAHLRRSTPASRARRRTAGEASGFSPIARPRRPRRGARFGAGLARARAAASARRWLRFAGRRRAPASAAQAAVRRRPPASARGCRPRRCPRPRPPGGPARRRPPATLPTSPPSASDRAGDRRRDLDRRLVGHHVGEDLVLAHRLSPTLTCHSTSSASAMPSPTSGSLMMRVPISGLHHGLEGTRRPAPGPGK